MMHAQDGNRMALEQQGPERMDVFKTATPPELLLENNRVRVLRVSFRPGEKAAMHSHPDYITYVTKSGELRMTSPSGDIETMSFEAGKAVYFNAESHEVENSGSSEVEAIVIEIK